MWMRCPEPHPLSSMETSVTFECPSFNILLPQLLPGLCCFLELFLREWKISEDSQPLNSFFFFQYSSPIPTYVTFVSLRGLIPLTS
jgi:hypothetical protein